MVVPIFSLSLLKYQKQPPLKNVFFIIRNLEKEKKDKTEIRKKTQKEIKQNKKEKEAEAKERVVFHPLFVVLNFRM